MRRPLLLNGFMGVGKSTIGRMVAKRTGHPFVDLDEIIEAKAQKTIERIFAEDGEDAFRAIETEALRGRLARAAPEVVALGGGALERRPIRLEALDRAVVVTLSASPEIILGRVRNRPGRPLLDVPDPAERIRTLLERRRLAYTEAHRTVSTEGQDRGAITREVVDVWSRDPLAVAAGERSYAVDVGVGITQRRLSDAPAAPVILLVSDDNVAPLHAEAARASLSSTGAEVRLITFPAGEDQKNAATLETLWRDALAAGADRQALFVGLGGGVVTDVTGFFAATWMRGVRWLAVPTTLLAMVDAAVGGKTAIDLPGAKNSVGAFWQPSAVVCDVALLGTEPERGYVSALAEVIKTAIIGDPGLFSMLEAESDAARARSREFLAEVVRRSVRVKARVVSADERESGARATLNLGHTVGHAIEAHGGYGHLRHGEAVSLGLVSALRIGVRLGATPQDLAERTVRLLRRVGLPTDLSTVPLAEAVDLIAHDKKRHGKDIKFIVAHGLGDVRLEPLELAELREHAIASVSG